MNQKHMCQILLFSILTCCFIIPLVQADTITVEYFYEEGCPTCEEVKSLINDIENEYNENITVYRYDVANNQYYELFKHYGFLTTPGVMINGTIRLNTSEITWINLLNAINASIFREKVEEDPCNITTYLGTINICQYSLPILTIMLGAIDSFNPCSFFILMFLLNLLIYVESRKRMFLIGGLFIAVSGVVYLFIMVMVYQASNVLFTVIDKNTVISVFIGLIALILGGFMLKDFFFFHQGLSLSLSENKKKSLFKRMRQIVRSTSLSSIIVGTIILAVLANTYELLCSLGVPFAYVGTLRSVYYIDTLPEVFPWLILYNIMYVIPLFIIVGLVTWRLNKQKLSERQGRILKLFSGLMMIMLGCTFIFVPALLKNAFSILGMVILAIICTICIVVFDKRYKTN